MRLIPKLIAFALVAAFCVLSLSARGLFESWRLDLVQFSQGLCAMFDAAADRWGYIDAKGAWALKPAWNIAKPFSEDLALVANFKDDYTISYGFIDKKGRKAFDASAYSWVAETGFSGGVAIVRSGGAAYSVIDKKGKGLATFDSVWPPSGFSEGLAAFAAEGLWGYLAPSGKVAIEPRFDWAMPFSEGLAVVWKGKDCFCVDKAGERVLDLPGVLAVDLGFKGGHLLASMRFGEEGRISRIIDRKGKAVREFSEGGPDPF